VTHELPVNSNAYQGCWEAFCGTAERLCHCGFRIPL
jgi:hypothetical protein